MLRRRSIGVGFALSLIAGCSSQTSSPPDTVARVSQDLYEGQGARLWTQNGNVVPMCWATPGYAREKQIVQDAVARTWVAESKLRITWLEGCPTTGSAMYVKVQIGRHGPIRQKDGTYVLDHSSDGQTRHVGMDTLSAPTTAPLDPQGTPGMTIWVEDGGTSSQPRLEYVGVHEMGHVLGFEHEQDRPKSESGVLLCRTMLCQQAKAGACNDDPTSTACTGFDMQGCLNAAASDEHGTEIGGYDGDSIMNYCNADGNAHGILSPGDVLGVKQVYGDSGRPAVFTVSDNHGPNGGGTAIFVTGYGFNAATTQFTFGGHPAKILNCPNSGECWVTTPAVAQSSSWTVDVLATVNGLSSEPYPGDRFTFDAGPSCASAYSCDGIGFGAPKIVITCPQATQFFTFWGTPSQTLAGTGTTFSADTNDTPYTIAACDEATGSCTPFGTLEPSASYCGAPPSPSTGPSMCEGTHPRGSCKLGWRCCGDDGWSCGDCN